MYSEWVMVCQHNLIMLMLKWLIQENIRNSKYLMCIFKTVLKLDNQHLKKWYRGGGTCSSPGEESKEE